VAQTIHLHVPLSLARVYYLYKYSHYYEKMRVPHPRFVRVDLRVAMPEKLKRYYGRGDLHFVTFSCYQRLPLLEKASARALVVKALERVREEYGFLLVGYVVMPEHVHLLISEPHRGTPSTVLHMLKQRISRRMRKEQQTALGQVNEASRESEADLRQFWQARFYDFNVFTEKKKREKLEYMHGNPVMRRLVGHPKDWLWSSWSNYARNGEGLIAVDLM
jgi:putative transposase